MLFTAKDTREREGWLLDFRLLETRVKEEDYLTAKGGKERKEMVGSLDYFFTTKGHEKGEIFAKELAPTNHKTGIKIICLTPVYFL